MKKLFTFTVLLSSISAWAEGEAFLKSINGNWELSSAHSRSLFIEKELCSEKIDIRASLENGVVVESLDPDNTYGFEITAEEIKTKQPDPRSEWGRYKGHLVLTDDSIKLVQKLPNILFGFRETFSIKKKNETLTIRTSMHAIMGHQTTICKYKRN